MNLALIGYGRMGKTIERLAVSQGHTIALIIDENNPQDISKLIDPSMQIDVAIEFSVPSIAKRNITSCIESGIPVVSGTTGWLDAFDEVIELTKKENGAFFYSSNYSIGVNLFFEISKYAAKLLNQQTGYDVRIHEVHHVHKLDAPSGTAITLANHILSAWDRKSSWIAGNEGNSDELQISSSREGEVSGIHIARFENDSDIVEIHHDAKNREGFAQGAIMAASFLMGKKGVFGMKDLLGI